MASWTSSDLRNAALRYLNVVHKNQTPSAEDAALVDEIWVSEHPRLVQRGLAPYTIDAIPEWAQEPLRKLVASKAAPSFGFSGSRLLSKQNEGRAGEQAIRIHLSQKRRDPTAFTYY